MEMTKITCSRGSGYNVLGSASWEGKMQQGIFNGKSMQGKQSLFRTTAQANRWWLMGKSWWMHECNGEKQKKWTKNDIFSPQQWEMHRHGHSPLNDAPTPSLDVKLIDLCVQITISVVLLRGKEELRLFPTCPDLRGRLFWCCCMSLVQRNSFFS